VSTGLYRVEQVMGMPITLHLAEPVPTQQLAPLADEVFAWLRRVDAVFSTYRTDSDVIRLSSGSPLADLDPELAGVLDRCASLWRETDGYFDVYATGRLDPSGYVKGWAVQRASDRLVAAGAPNHQLNAGGDLVARGRPEPGRVWRLGIQHPFHGDALAWVLAGDDLVVATSGNYARGTHIVDPHTGRPAAGLASVTIVGRCDQVDLGSIDAYATAALAMGPAGLGWLARLDAVRPGLHSAAVTDDGRAFTSPGLPLAA
jgi:FAD:protein FMN transferase